MASKAEGSNTVKPSFAKVSPRRHFGSQRPGELTRVDDQVAASNYKPTGPKKIDTTIAATPVEQTVGPSNAAGNPSVPATSEMQTPTIVTTKPPVVSKATPTVASSATAKGIKMPQVGERPLPDGIKNSIADDNSTQVSSSGGSAKVPSLDGKSTTSGTTFAMDEKESLRPDDSASLRAVEEEDAFSPAESVNAESRNGSDTGAQAFRDQLHEIAVIDPMSKRYPGDVPAPPPVSHPAGNPGDAFNNPMQEYSLPVRPDTNPTNGMPQPDEKLIEALQSYRDRVWVLKLEQDVLDFIKNPSEQQLDLPQCNSFYRMLAHRMADYYMLRHTLDPSGNAVRIHKTDFNRLPAPLCSWPVVSTITPPPSLPARTIMRRSDDGKNTPNTDAAGSKSNSEVGADGTSEGGDAKSKGQLSREEREAKYKEARMRIFGSSEETENADGEINPDNADISRSSSVAGKRKAANKKQRNYDNDGFEARSQFNPYYAPPPTYMAPDNNYYAGYPGMGNNTPYPPNGTNAMASNGSFQPMPQSPTGLGWQQPQFMGPPQNVGSPMYTAPSGQMFDLSADFQRGMQSFQNSASSPQMPPRYPVHNGPAKSGFPMQQYPQQWPQSPVMPNMPNPSPGMGNNNMSFNFPPGPNMGHPQHSYGMPPGSPYFNGNGARVQSAGYPHNRQQFNPQSQSFNPQSQTFIPGSQNQMNMGPMPTHNGPIGPYPPNRNMTPSSTLNHTTAHSSITPNRAQPNGQTPPSTNSTATASAGNSATNSMGSLTHPLPHPPPTQSSISKWGTPSSLPQKPPPPATMQPEKFIETHRGTPPHAIPGMPRMPSAAGMLGIAPMAMFTGNGMSGRGTGQK
ncbi:hypothetical protein P152DRAFT_493708 [Eremomyces bilateralis CBS 781.70]|uniref:SUZ domain-containing protein n=1 Tax=Eremomyces bilateralis CBS 781.70 TaxID=1392243 RepID=A0A6G1FWH6_9PEZI|nr:uncharacterized protein P152DRAFT_493708 [Eremomyces bilateralis CBS 781.70]KAF1809979.1 hypothetical protein P152DRAFT_493708 [Eremomyces bilateralis CBS 781.70]